MKTYNTGPDDVVVRHTEGYPAGTVIFPAGTILHYKGFPVRLIHDTEIYSGGATIGVFDGLAKTQKTHTPDDVWNRVQNIQNEYDSKK